MWVWAALTHTRFNVVCNGTGKKTSALATRLGLWDGLLHHLWPSWELKSWSKSASATGLIQQLHSIREWDQKKSSKIHQAVHMICCSAAIRFLSQANLLLYQRETQRISLNPWNKFEQVTLSCGWSWRTVTKARKGEQNNMFTLWSLRPPL